MGEWAWFKGSQVQVLSARPENEQVRGPFPPVAGTASSSFSPLRLSSVCADPPAGLRNSPIAEDPDGCASGNGVC